MAPRGCLLLPLIFIVSPRVILAQGACGDKPSNPCDPVDDSICANCPTYDPVPNPQDCNSYYMCNNNVLITDDPIFCPDGNIFDLSSKNCKPDDGKCTPYCENSGGGNCLYTCGKNVVGFLIADPFDCSVFYECVSDGSSDVKPGPAKTCPADKPYFDGEKCGVDESACCHCRPYCYPGDEGKKVEDPTDCRKYFFCTAEENVPSLQGECEDNKHFDLHAGKCSSTAPCMTLCRNVVDKDGCIDPYTCQEIGYFPVCKSQCLQDYYHCREVSDDFALPETCPNGLVFNPDTLQCVKNETCPYHKSLPH
ncbi:latent-transforming growth factor beta-binding protein 4-like [Scylla paramamosain]|uniref:latent-transforming growth factor beta-binding protein 4-like n=1 Tax=Scylla paramamosain TaxID=85552 RepID=UPI003082DEA8